MNRKKKSIGFSSPANIFKRRYLPPTGVFAIQQEFDDNYVLTSLRFIQNILSYTDGEIDAFEIKVSEDAAVSKLVRDIQKIMGDEFEVKSLDVSWRSCPDVLEMVNKVFGNADKLKPFDENKFAVKLWSGIWKKHESILLRNKF